MRLFRRFGAAALLATAAAVLLAAPAFAHLDVTVGNYATVVGWLDEPAIQGQMNGLDITVLTTPAAQPVTGLENTLKADVQYGSVKETLSLTPQDGKPGHYTAPIAPSQAGGYKVRLYGTVDGTPFDHTYDLGSDPDMVVQAFSTVAFPSTATAAPTASSGATAPAASTASTATAPASPAQPHAGAALWLALILGAVGTVTGLVGLASRRRRGSA